MCLQSDHTFKVLVVNIHIFIHLLCLLLTNSTLTELTNMHVFPCFCISMIITSVRKLLANGVYPDEVKRLICLRTVHTHTHTSIHTHTHKTRVTYIHVCTHVYEFQYPMLQFELIQCYRIGPWKRSLADMI